MHIRFTDSSTTLDTLESDGRHIAIYCRVSTGQQDTKSQEPDLKRYAAAQKGNVQWYFDKASGKSMERPAWRKLEEELRAGNVTAIVVWGLDRLGRTASGLTALFDELQTRKVNLVSIKDAIDLSTPAGRLMACVLASVAAYETEVRAERVRAGQDVARAKGKKWGGSKAGERTKVTPMQRKIIRQLKSEGSTVSAIAKAVNLSRPTVYKVLETVDP